MAQTLQGKVVVITGASSGIGEATATMLAAQGAKVALLARRQDRINRLAETIGGGAMAIACDVTDKQAASAAIGQVAEAYGQIDILVNNAGVMLLGPAKDAPLEEWERMINVNLLGLLYVTYAALPVMTKAGAGDIVNISSVAGRIARSGSAVYNATKWGVNAFTEALRQELVEQHTGVRTTLIEPGAVATELQSHNRPEVQDALKSRFGDITMLQSEDIARAIVYAVSQPAHVSINEMLIRPSQQLG